jgi:prevent-host-death family protein
MTSSQQTPEPKETHMAGPDMLAGGESTTPTKKSEITEVRHNLAEIINQVAYGGERVVITRHGKQLVALVPIEDYELLEELEDRIDLAKTRAALEEAKAQGTIPWEQVKAELDL